MIKLLSQSVFNSFMDKSVINKEDEDIYAYGTEIAVSYLINLIAIIIIGALTNMLIECIVFLIIFVPLRSFAGGYHAPNYQICFVISCFIVTAVLLITKYTAVHTDEFILFSIIAIAGILIYILGPIEDKNKPLTEKENIHYKRKMKTILIIEFILAVIMNVAGLHNILFVFCSSFVIVLVLSLLGFIKNRINESYV